MPKYERQNPLLKLHRGEPYFFVRAQDKLSPAAVRGYADLLDQEASDLQATNGEKSRHLAQQACEVRAFAEEFELWQGLNQDLVKLPD